MSVEIVVIGSEFLLGQSVDTNSAWISERLAEVGVSCYFHSTVGDNVDRISSILNNSLSRSDVVITTGGLGPTHDDLTRQALANVLGVGLEQDPEIEEKIRAKFQERNREMSPNNLLQALKPEGSEFMDDFLGSAPGIFCDANDKFIFSLPGVPFEMKHLIHEFVLPKILEKYNIRKYIESKSIMLNGIPESKLAALLENKIQSYDDEKLNQNITLALLASDINGIKIRLTASGDSKSEIDALLNEETDDLKKLLGDLIFSTDGKSLEQVVVDLLKARGASLAVAESFTGGLLASRICSVPGASEVFKGGIVSYATQIKESLLNVDTSKFGVVSEETALQMAKSASNILDTDFGLATTGVAGPETLEGKKVGTVCLAVYSEDNSFSTTNIFAKSRDHIANLGSTYALDILRHQLEN